jgi:tetratricopeptide (TPR) repeat protein
MSPKLVKTRLRPGLVCLLLAAGASSLAAAAAEKPNWLDIESRVQYSYYTEDMRALANVTEGLGSVESDSAFRRYFAGLIDYRLTLLHWSSDKSRAKEAADECVDNLDVAVKLQRNFADALALESACLDLLAGLQAWRAPFAASKSGALIEKARHLEPKNPRVLLLDAVSLYERPKTTAADKDRALQGFQQATAAFEAERRETQHVPGWGDAEAYVYLAKCQLDRGAALQARDALERALLIAPEFAEARRLMKKLTSG